MKLTKKQREAADKAAAKGRRRAKELTDQANQRTPAEQAKHRREIQAQDAKTMRRNARATLARLRSRRR